MSPHREHPPEDVAAGARSLGALARLERDCQRCELYLPATQVVPGRGARHR